MSTEETFSVSSGAPWAAEEGLFQGYSNGEITTIPLAGRLMLASRSNNEPRSHNQVPKVEQLILLNGHLVLGLMP